MCALRAHIKVSVFGNTFLGIEKAVITFFNCRENVYKNRKFNVCPKGTH